MTARRFMPAGNHREPEPALLVVRSISTAYPTGPIPGMREASTGACCAAVHRGAKEPVGVNPCTTVMV